MASALVSLISDVRLVVKDVSWLGTAALICIGTFAVSSLVITRRQRNRKRNLVSGDFALPEVAAAKEAGEMLKTAKVDNTKDEFKVWCGFVISGSRRMRSVLWFEEKPITPAVTQVSRS
jgi:hypothetical protein